MFNDAVHWLDARDSGSLRASNGCTWRAVTDTVMGGVSHASLLPETWLQRPCLHLRGEVSLENQGGFVQASLDLHADGLLDASAWKGLLLEMGGNGEQYNLHLRTTDRRIVWQSYRASFVAAPAWQTLHIPFTHFRPHRLWQPLDVRTLRRLGIVAIGRVMTADLHIGRVGLYR